MTSSRSRRPAAPGQTAPIADSEEARALTAVPEATRGGEDTRRRGWFWHWNALVTQYAPLIGLKGVGLLNSYTVWTDRREESPHRGYAFPSQQSEADFYGEDRAELITINKILVALDLIEIRKEMVLRADPRGRRWKVPHNFYRVKDHGDDFTLSAADVLRVAELANRDRAVYRYVRRVFSPRFAPIDGDNVWGRILPEVRQRGVWQSLAARAAAEEKRASARTRAGHAARRGSSLEAESSPALHETAPFFAPSDRDDAATETGVNDSDSVASDNGGKTSVATTNTGSAIDVGGTNRGSGEKRASGVAPANTGRPTGVAPTNTTYHQSSTTTRDEVHDERETIHTAGERPLSAREREAMAAGPALRPPADAAGEAAALRAFASANDRAPTPAEHKLLRDLAARFALVAATAAQTREDVPESGWAWLEAAVWEAVEAGSAFVAPRRVREILLRWEREGFPAPRDPAPVQTGRKAPRASTARSDAPAAPPPLPSHFTVEEVGLSSRQVWAATLAEVARQGHVSRADLETWLRSASLIGRAGQTLIVGAPNAVARDRIAARLLFPLRAALAATLGVPVEIEVVYEEGDRVVG